MPDNLEQYLATFASEDPEDDCWMCRVGGSYWVCCNCPLFVNGDEHWTDTTGIDEGWRDTRYSATGPWDDADYRYYV